MPAAKGSATSKIWVDDGSNETAAASAAGTNDAGTLHGRVDTRTARTLGGSHAPLVVKKEREAEDDEGTDILRSEVGSDLI